MIATAVGSIKYRCAYADRSVQDVTRRFAVGGSRWDRTMLYIMPPLRRPSAGGACVPLLRGLLPFGFLNARGLWFPAEPVHREVRS